MGKPKSVGLQTIFIGIGEAEDPFPEIRKPTVYWVFAGACPGCGGATRFLLPGPDVFCIVCRSCRHRQDVGLASVLAAQVTYVHWCRDSRFPSDETVMSQEALDGIEACIKKLGGKVEAPAWGVKIVGMKCEHADRCIASGCPYLLASRTEDKKVINLARRRMKRGK